MVAGAKGHLQPDIVLKVLDLALPVLRRDVRLTKPCGVVDALGWCGALALAQRDTRTHTQGEVGKYSEAWINASGARQKMMEQLMEHVGDDMVAALVSVVASKVPSKYRGKVKAAATAGAAAAVRAGAAKAEAKLAERFAGGPPPKPPSPKPRAPSKKEQVKALVRGLLAVDDEVVADTVFRLLGLTGRGLPAAAEHKARLLLRLMIVLTKRDTSALARLLHKPRHVEDLFSLVLTEKLARPVPQHVLALVHLLKLSAGGEGTALTRNQLDVFESARMALQALLTFSRPEAAPERAATVATVHEYAKESNSLLQPIVLDWLAQRLELAPLVLESTLLLASRQLDLVAAAATGGSSGSAHRSQEGQHQHQQSLPQHLSRADRRRLLATMRDHPTMRLLLRATHADRVQGTGAGAGAGAAGAGAGLRPSSYEPSAVWLLLLMASRDEAHVRAAAVELAYEYVFDTCGRLLNDSHERVLAELALIGRGLQTLLETPHNALQGLVRELGLAESTIDVGMLRHALREASQRLHIAAHGAPLDPDGNVQRRGVVCWRLCASGCVRRACSHETHTFMTLCLWVMHTVQQR